ncbi:MAG TPA: autotransporter-associated beta strand repeat-containing protein [Candidatus Acidoferrum sp.]|nr:autotransporter-associated beta strand repeat-containing protein [Candidatus Acidoferrum sp.]
MTKHPVAAIRMNPSILRTTLSLLCLLLLAGAGMVRAADVIKADNSNALNLGTSWVSGAPPAAADVAVWDSTVTAANTVSLGASTNWYGIRVANPGGAVTILTNTPQTLTLGLGGIDLSAATQDLSLSNAVTIGPGGLQKWNVAAGRALRTLALPTKATQPAASSSGGLQFSTTGTIQLGGAAVPLLIDPGNNPYATYGQSDWAALDSSGNVIAATYTDASTALTAGANNNIVGDFNINATVDVSSMRFNDTTPHTINISTSGTSRTLTGRGILMTPVCAGATIGGTVTSSFIRPNRVSTAGAAFDIYQNSLVGDLTINVTWGDASSSTPVQLVKFGPGNLNIGGGVGNSFRGGVVINGGTLTLAGGTGLGSSAITVNSGKLVLNGANTMYNTTATFNTGTTNTVKVTAANGQAFIGTNLTFSAGATRLEFSYNNAVPMSPTAAPLLTSNLTANSTVTMDIFNGMMAVGAYPLIKFTNAAPNFAAFALGFLPPRVSAQLSNDTANTSIDLVVTAVSEPIRWATGNGVWDTSTPNWVDPLGASTAYQEVRGYGDAVLLEDTQSSGSPIITLNTTLSPAGLTANASKSFTITGSGAIAGLGSVTKQGSGTLTLGTVNTYTGGVNVNGGILSFSAQENLGATNSAVSFGGGTLQYASGNTADISIRTVTLGSGGGTINDGGNAVSFANPIGNGGVGGLTKAGAGTLTLNGTNRYSGNTLISQGMLVLGGSTYISNSPAIIVNSGTTFDAASVGLTLSPAAGQVLCGSGQVNGPVVVPTGTTISPGTNGVTGTLTLNGDLTMSGGTLVYDVSTSAGDLLVANNVTLNSGYVQVAAGSLTNGLYKIIQYSGSLSGLAANLQVVGFSQLNKVVNLSDSTPGEIDLVVMTGRGTNLVWQGDGSANLWDEEGAYNWTNSTGVPMQFFNVDNVTFNDTSPNTTVNLVGVLQPGSVTVNSVNDYTFQDSGTGSGKINGTASLTKSGSGTLTILTPNINSGPTLINAGTVQVGNGGTTGDIGTGNVTNNGALVFMQTDNRSVPGQVSGAGSLTQQGSATLTLMQNNTYTGPTTINSGALQLGTGGATGSLGSGAVTNSGTLIYNHSGTFSVGNIKTGQSGGGTLVFSGPATVTLNGGNTYQNNTYISNGVVKMAAATVIPSSATDLNSSGWLVLDGGPSSAGLLDVNGFNLTVNALSGLGGTVVGVISNSASSGTNILTVLGTAGTTYSGQIVDGAGGAKEMLILRGANTLRLNGNNTYSGGTFVGDTATLAFGPGATVGNGGGIVLSNGTTFEMMNNGSTSAFPGNNLILPSGATVTLASSQLGNAFAGLMYGDATTTNVIATQVSMNANNVQQYSNFLGVVQVQSAGALRFSNTSLNANGGDNTSFELEGWIETRNGTGNGAGVSLGALSGVAGTLSGGVNADGNGVYVIGARNLNTTFSGTVSGSPPRGLSLVKVGTGRLTLDGTLSYVGSTTVSNGVLAIGSVNNNSASLDNSPTINIEGAAAMLDVSARSDGTLNLGDSTNQVLNGFGTIEGSLNEEANSTVNVSIGTLTVTGTATLDGVLNMWLNRTNAAPCSELVASSFTVGASAVLNVTNSGPNLVNGDTFRLFSRLVSGFASVTLPPFDSTGTNAYVWTNKLAVDGTIELVSGGILPVNTTPTNISYAVSGSTLTLSWPADHTTWRLLVQTNKLAAGLSTNMADWGEVTGSANTNQVFITIDPAKPTEFYRMVYP